MCVRPSFIFLHLRDLRVRVLRRFPLLVRRLLVLPGPVETSQIRPRRCLHPGRLRQTPHERLVGFARVPPLDAPHRRVRFQRRRIDADRLPPHQTRSRQPLQNPREHGLVGLYVDPPPGARQRRVIRRRLGQLQVQKRPQTQRIRHPPRNPALRRQTLEIADEQHPEIPTRTQTRPSQPVRVEGRAQLLDERIESGIRQDPVQPLEVRMPIVRRKVRRVHPHRRRLARRRSLAHRHAVQCTKLDRAGARPDPRLSPQAVKALLLRRVIYGLSGGFGPARGSSISSSASQVAFLRSAPGPGLGSRPRCRAGRLAGLGGCGGRCWRGRVAIRVTCPGFSEGARSPGRLHNKRLPSTRLLSRLLPRSASDAFNTRGVRVREVNSPRRPTSEPARISPRGTIGVASGADSSVAASRLNDEPSSVQAMLRAPASGQSATTTVPQGVHCATIPLSKGLDSVSLTSCDVLENSTVQPLKLDAEEDHSAGSFVLAAVTQVA